MPTLDAQRHRAQRAFLDSGAALTLGQAHHCPLTPGQLAALTSDSAHLVRRIDSGLTATIYQLRVDGRDYALKRARAQCLVQNADGQTSFLNELQRRADIDQLARRHGQFERFVPTIYGSLAHGLIVMPWISGQSVVDWDERRLRQLFDSGRELLEHGLFEWDYSPGNLLDDGATLWQYDYGYMYRFDPLCQFNSAGRGADTALFHLAERFETRSFFGWLLGRERELGQDAALAAFRLEKQVALECYERLRANLNERGATPTVLAWLDGIMHAWRVALHGDLATLYLKEGWRSHVMDLDDDLRGQTCTPGTLARCDWLLATLEHHLDALRACDALLHSDVDCDQASLLLRYQGYRAQAQRYQLGGRAA